MIYQLKITLKDTKPPIWRRILVHKDMLLTDLHETIQIAFEWLDMHLHCFEARKTNGYSLTTRNIQIGMNDGDFFDLTEYDYDECEERLSDWLVKEKDKLVYVYDFGDDWRHEIVLEKILEPEPGQTYPYCVKAMRGPAMEDSGGFVEEAEEVDPEEIRRVINRQLDDIASEVELEEPSSHSEGDWSRLLELVKEFSKLAPWRWLDDDQIIAVQMPNSQEYAYCSVMGAAGEEFGLAAFIGSEGIDYLKKLMRNHWMDEAQFYDNRSITLSLSNREELSPTDYEIIKEAGYTFRGKHQWPMFRSIVPGYFPWHLSPDEINLFTIILERVIDVCSRAKDELEIEPFGTRDTLFAQSISEGKKWIDSRISMTSEERGVPEPKVFIDELKLQRLKAYKRINVSIEIGVFNNPNPVQEKPKMTPYFPIVFIGAHRKKQMILFHDMLHPKDKEKQYQESFLKMLENLQGVPREMWMTKEMFLILKPILEKLNTTVMQVEELPIIEEVKASMYQFFQ